MNKRLSTEDKGDRIMSRRKRIAGILIPALVIVLSMSTGVFAVSGAIDSDRTDYVTDRTGNSTAVRQANSSETGTIRLGKILTVNQSGKFPNIEDFVYKITPVAAWENENVSTSKSGAEINTAKMPRPEPSSEAHHNIINIAPDDRDNGPWTALVTIGNFRDAAEDDTSSVYGDRKHGYTVSDEASNIAKIDEGKRRTRVTDVSFRFSKAGYYMYRIEEAGSRQNGAIDSLSGLRKDVRGVDYDNNTYYVVFYVCNKEAENDEGTDEYGHGTKKGDTVDGVYVHTITSWTNRASGRDDKENATDYRPDNSMRTSDELADAENWLHDLMQSQDVDSKYETEHGDGGHSAGQNTGRVENDSSSGPSTVMHDDLGKVGISTPYEPDFLEAYRMWNGQVTHDIVIKKIVTGNLGDRAKRFVFEIKLTGLEANQTYTTDVPAGSTDETADAGEPTNDVTSPGVKMYDMEPAACLAEDGRSFTTDSTGAVTFRADLTDGDILVINSLPRSASYQVKEMASDHVPQYNIVSTNKSTKNRAVFTETGHTPGGDDDDHLGEAGKDSYTDLVTKLEFVDRYDGTVVIVFRNDRDLATLTGFAGLDYVVYAAALAVVLTVALLIIRRRREYAAEEDFLA